MPDRRNPRAAQGGADPVVTSEKRIDPVQDVAWAAGRRASQGGAAAAAANRRLGKVLAR